MALLFVQEIGIAWPNPCL